MKKAVLLAGLVALAGFPPAHADENASSAQWYPQRARTAEFKFSAYALAEEGERPQLQAFRVVSRKTGQVVQEFRDIDALGSWHKPDELVRLVDANFDGHPDLVIDHGDGGAGPNFTQNFYLYNPAARRFALH